MFHFCCSRFTGSTTAKALVEVVVATTEKVDEAMIEKAVGLTVADLSPTRGKAVDPRAEDP